MNAKEFYEKFIAAMREENIATNEQIKKHLDQVGWTYKKIIENVNRLLRN